MKAKTIGKRKAKNKLVTSKRVKRVVKKLTPKLYDTRNKRIATLKEKGNIITFKKDQTNGTKTFQQLVTLGFVTTQKKEVKIIAMGFDTKYYKNIDVLLDAIDWDWMERKHAGQKN